MRKDLHEAMLAFEKSTQSVTDGVTILGGSADALRDVVGDRYDDAQLAAHAVSRAPRARSARRLERTG